MAFNIEITECVDSSFNGTYCKVDAGYFYQGVLYSGIPNQITERVLYEKYDDPNKKIFFEQYDLSDTSGVWILAEDFNGFNEVDYAQPTFQSSSQPSGAWQSCNLSYVNQCSSSSSSSSSGSMSNSLSSSSDSLSSSSSINMFDINAFRVSGVSEESYNSVYCGYRYRYYTKAQGFVDGGNRYIYTNRGNSNLALCYVDYGTGFWVLIDTNDFNGVNEKDVIASSLNTPPLGNWNEATLSEDDCSSSSSSSSSSESLSSSSSESLSSSSSESLSSSSSESLSSSSSESLSLSSSSESLSESLSSSSSESLSSSSSESLSSSSSDSLSSSSSSEEE